MANNLIRDCYWVANPAHPITLSRVITGWQTLQTDGGPRSPLVPSFSKIHLNSFQKKRQVLGGVMIQFYRWPFSFPPLAEPQNPRAVRLVNKLIGNTTHATCLKAVFGKNDGFANPLRQ